MKQKLFVCTCMHARTPTHLDGCAHVGVGEGEREGEEKEKYFPWFCIFAAQDLAIGDFQAWI